MPIDPWDALRATIRKAHLAGTTSGPVVQLYDRLVDKSKMPSRGVLDLYGFWIPTRGDEYTIYGISTFAEAASSVKVYWLPPTHNATVGVNVLDVSNADLFLAIGFSGGQFVSCDGIFVQNTAAYMSSNQPTFPKIAVPDKDPSLSPRAVVMGSRSPQTMQWFFAHGNVDPDSTNYGKWRSLQIVQQ